MENLIKLKQFKFSWISGFNNASYRYWYVEVTLEYLLFQAFQYFYFEKGISVLRKTGDAAMQLCLLHAKPPCAAGILAEGGSPGCKVNLYWLSVWKEKSLQQTGDFLYFKSGFTHPPLFFCLHTSHFSSGQHGRCSWVFTLHIYRSLSQSIGLTWGPYIFSKRCKLLSDVTESVAAGYRLPLPSCLVVGWRYSSKQGCTTSPPYLQALSVCSGGSALPTIIES